MSLTCKVQIALNNISPKKAETIKKALEPDNVNFPENLTLEIENVDNKLVFTFQSQNNTELKHDLISPSHFSNNKI